MRLWLALIALWAGAAWAAPADLVRGRAEAGRVGQPLDLHMLLQPRLMIPLAALAALIIFAAVFWTVRQRRRRRGS